MSDDGMKDSADSLPGALSTAARAQLLAVARRRLASVLGGTKSGEEGAAHSSSAVSSGMSPDLKDRSGGAFVTLKRQGRLRGCIGHLTDDRPLVETVQDMAVQAALHDSRFPPLSPDELNDVHMEISVLTPFCRVNGPEDIVAGRDGVLIRKDGRRAVFLPQVAAEQGWDVPVMLDHLCRKAGLPARAWREPGMEFQIFQAQVFGEPEA